MPTTTESARPQGGKAYCSRCGDNTYHWLYEDGRRNCTDCGNRTRPNPMRPNAGAYLRARSY